MTFQIPPHLILVTFCLNSHLVNVNSMWGLCVPNTLTFSLLKEELYRHTRLLTILLCVGGAIGAEDGPRTRNDTFWPYSWHRFLCLLEVASQGAWGPRASGEKKPP